MKKKIPLLIAAFFMISISLFIYSYLIYPFTYGPEKALRNGDVIVGAGGENSDIFYRFLQNVGNKQPDRIRITIYGKEGEPSLIDLEFDGKIIYYKEDATRKYFGDHRYKKTGTYTDIRKETKNGSHEYFLTNPFASFGDVWIYQD